MAFDKKSLLLLIIGVGVNPTLPCHFEAWCGPARCNAGPVVDPFGRPVVLDHRQLRPTRRCSDRSPLRGRGPVGERHRRHRCQAGPGGARLAGPRQPLDVRGRRPGRPRRLLRRRAPVRPDQSRPAARGRRLHSGEPDVDEGHGERSEEAAPSGRRAPGLPKRMVRRARVEGPEDRRGKDGQLSR